MFQISLVEKTSQWSNTMNISAHEKKQAEMFCAVSFFSFTSIIHNSSHFIQLMIKLIIQTYRSNITLLSPEVWSSQA